MQKVVGVFSSWCKGGSGKLHRQLYKRGLSAVWYTVEHSGPSLLCSSAAPKGSR